MPKKTGGKKKGISVDFTGVESGGKAVPDGVYEFEVMEVTEETSESNNQYLKWKSKVISEGPASGGIVYDNTSLQPQALWRLKGFLECLGVEVPDSSMELDLEEYVGMTFTATVANENYQGKDRPKIAQYGGEVDEGPKSSSSSKVSSKKPSTTSKSEVDEDDDIPFKKGQKVSFKEGKKTYTGKVTEIENDSATVDVDGEEWEIEVGDLTKA